ncbi:MAG TPA: carboxypeptidase regulatory-like domain-containing protein [Thermoanaerobaculia bacterium]|jgi:hypothetical protein|nr:carboxypeptidase regulatory-like domain-containing protein [Thermoanaerobaculia bacterium]
MRFLFAPFPVTGRVNPGLPIARELVARGHDVHWSTMPRFGRAVMKGFALLLVLFALACGRMHDPVRLDPAVYGTVSDAASGEPLDAARVAIDHRNGLTAPNGAYYIAGVENGPHTLRVTKEGYVPYSTTIDVNEELVSLKVKLERQ